MNSTTLQREIVRQAREKGAAAERQRIRAAVDGLLIPVTTDMETARYNMALGDVIVAIDGKDENNEQ